MGKPVRYFKKLIGLIIFLFFIQCAQRVGISGGEKDTSPPVLLRSVPDTFATHFNSYKIKLEFDEFIKLDKVNRNLLITPVMRYDPEIVVSGKSVLIKNIDDSLWENTTYVIEFNEAIQDITEKNTSKGFRYVFSTGDYVDSLEVNGQVKDAFTLSPMEDVYVFLYESNYDSIPYLEKPRYIGLSDKNGFFKIQNMKKGTYKVFMSTDNNKNYLYDMADEKMDFLDSTIVLSDDTGQTINGHLFVEDKGEQYMKGYGMLNRWAFYLSFQSKVDTIHIEPWDNLEFPEEQFGRSYNPEGDSVVFWLLDSTKSEKKWNIYVYVNAFQIDTVELVLYEDKTPKKLAVKSNVEGGFLKLGGQLEYDFDYPIIKLDTGKIQLYRDSVLMSYHIEMNATKRKLTFISEWNEKSRYHIIFDTAAITDIYGMSNDSMVKTFLTRNINHYGTMEITLKGLKAGKGILMIIDKKGGVIKQAYLNNTDDYFFEYIDPGEYFLKYILDENGNERWDPGNYLEKRHAEPVFIYQETITIRSNWDQVIEWKFNL